jgi:hypothetical protein
MPRTIPHRKAIGQIQSPKKTADQNVISHDFLYRVQAEADLLNSLYIRFWSNARRSV